MTGTERGLNGIRVIEIAGGVGVAYAAKLFADLGADVVRVEGDHDVVRARPHDVHRWLNTNKRSVVGGLPALLADADILLHDRSAADAVGERLTESELRATNPTLVVCSVTPFGMTGPYSGFAAEELNIIHGSSWGFLSPGASSRPDLAPLKAPGHHATINAATAAAAAALAAFDRRERTGVGACIDFSLFAAAAKMTETAPASVAFHGEDCSRLGVKSIVPWGVYACADGLVQLICPEQAQWLAFVKLMGDPDWAQLDVFATNADRRNNIDMVDHYVAEWMAGQHVAELSCSAQAARVCITPVNTMAQLAADPHLVARHFFARTPDGLELPGPGFTTDPPWWGLRASAPQHGAHTGQDWLPRADRPAVAMPNQATAAAARPFEGVRVCDFSWIWAGPFCTQYLAHLGADVIRIESSEHLCLFRRLAFAPAGMELTPDTAGVFQLYNTDKRSVGIELGHPDARRVIEELVAKSDVVVDNFGVGTMARLGFGADDLRRINPNVIVVSLTGYGQTGPAAGFMAYGPVGGAVAGLYAATGYEGGRAEETGVAVGDPCTGLTALWATTAALVARRRNGEVARIDVAMVEAVAATVGELWMEYVHTGAVPMPNGNHDAAWSPHNCYRTAGTDEWVTIACSSDDQWRALCGVVDPGLVHDPCFSSMQLRKSNEAALDDVIAAWAGSRERWVITRQLQDVGVAAFPSLSPRELWGGDPHLAALGMLECPEHPVVGRRIIPGVPWTIHPGPNGLRSAAPLLGQHTGEVLSDVLGLPDDEILRLTQIGCVSGVLAKP